MSTPEDDKNISSSRGLRPITEQKGTRSRPAPDPELKAVLDDLNRRYRVMRERLEGEDDAPGVV